MLKKVLRIREKKIGQLELDYRNFTLYFFFFFLTLYFFFFFLTLYFFLLCAINNRCASIGKDTQRLNIKLPPASVTSSFNIVSLRVVFGSTCSIRFSIVFDLLFVYFKVYIEQCNHSVKFGAIAPEEKPVPRHPRPKVILIFFIYMLYLWIISFIFFTSMSVCLLFKQIRVVLRPKSPWNISKSVFATYQMDTTTVLVCINYTNSTSHFIFLFPLPPSPSLFLSFFTVLL